MGALALRIVSNAQLDREKRATTTEARQSDPAYTGLAGHIERFWQAAQSAKVQIEFKMLQNLRQRMGVYEPSELALIRQQGGSEIFMMLTQGKCRGAESWLREVLCNEIDRPWGLDPTPMPDLPPAVSEAVIQAVANQAIAAGWEVDDARVDELLLTVKEAARKRIKDIAKKIAERHELVIADQFAEGGWEQALSDFIYDLVTFPAAFIKGPIKRMQKTGRWLPGANGQWVYSVGDAIRPEWERRSPFDIFPAPAMKNLQRGNLIDRYRFTREDLQSLKGVPGYSVDAIDAVIAVYGDHGYASRKYTDTERAVLELRPNENYDPEGTIEALNFWGSCSGSMLLEWGFQNNVELNVGEIDPTKEYQVEAWKIGRYIIKAQLNPDPLGLKPYTKCSFEELPGAFWGQGMPEVIRDCQGMCNGAARALANNAAIASGPQVEVNVDRLADGEMVTKLYPWKIYQTTTDMSGNNQRAVNFWQASMNVQELLTIYSHFERVADNVTGFPAYSYGDSKVGGAGRTASGLSQMMGNVGRGVRRVTAAVDRTTIKPHVSGAFNYNMQFSTDPGIKGDLRACPKGSAAVLIKAEVSLRQKELAQMLLNPLDAQIIGVEGRAEIDRQLLKNADFDVSKILPSAEELALRTAGMPPPHQLLGKTGPNASATPGAGGTGGTPAGDENVDGAGNPPNGTQVREQTQGAPQGFADGGPVRRYSVDAGV